jgi:NAD(P)H-hydrate repair Nnr-like enzyme with NAD(P)H-hydrate epimerase domain
MLRIEQKRFKKKRKEKKAFVVTGGGRDGGDCAGAVPATFSNQSRLSLSSIGAEVRDKTKRKREWVVRGGVGKLG